MSRRQIYIRHWTFLSSLDMSCTCKYVFTQIDNLGCFTDASSSKVKEPIKDIRMTIVEPNPRWAETNNKSTIKNKHKYQSAIKTNKLHQRNFWVKYLQQDNIFANRTYAISALASLQDATKCNISLLCIANSLSTS